MKLFDILKNDYFRLFVKREGKVVLGKNHSNLWLLTAVLTATFLAIAFSNASLSYLSLKMDDPFINWVDIKNDYGEGNFYGLEYALDSDLNKEEYHYNDYQKDYYYTFMFYGKDDDVIEYLKCRFFENLNTDLVRDILKDDNVIKGWKVNDISEVDENTIGVIITEEAMKKLGYTRAPAYIDHQNFIEIVSAYDYCLDIVEETDEYAATRLPFPVLGVVKRLPGNVDLISGSYFYKQYWNDSTHPFNLAKDIYSENLSYFVPAEVDAEAFKTDVLDAAAELCDAQVEADDVSFYVPQIVPFKDGGFIKFMSYDYVEYAVWKEIHDKVMEKYGEQDVHRVYDYDFSEYTPSQKAFISVYFKDLDKLKEFEEFVRREFKVKIEMAQINAKENFNAVSVMGNILSWVIIIFAIVCIILFIVNLLQSYFQKVKRNLGTFKAFGISNRDLISVYVLIMAAIILGAIFMSVSVTWLVQGIMHICGILKDGVFDYLLLWSYKTVISIAVIICASIFTVYAVMHRLLKATPGDLIYDRR